MYIIYDVYLCLGGFGLCVMDCSPVCGRSHESLVVARVSSSSTNDFGVYVWIAG